MGVHAIPFRKRGPVRPWCDAVRPVVMALLMLCSAVTPCAAQIGEWLSLGLSAARTEIRAEEFDDDEEVISGWLYGIEGQATLWRLHVRAEYRQGRPDQENLDGASTRVATARASFGVRPIPWVAVTGGPTYTTIDLPDGDRNILRWRVEAHGNAPIVAGVVSAFASLGGTVAGTDLEGFSPLGGGGGELGIVLGAEDRPVWARLGFRMERETSFEDGASQTLETTYITIGVAAPRAGR